MAAKYPQKSISGNSNSLFFKKFKGVSAGAS